MASVSLGCRLAQRLGLRLLVLVASVVAIVGCGGGAKAKTRASSATLVVHAEPGDAEVWLNSRYFRSAEELARGARLRPGHYRIELRHSGFHSRYLEIELKSSERRVLEISMARRLL